MTLKIAIVLGSTRPGRNGEAVAKWAHEIAARRDDAEFELVDIADFKLPHLDEAVPPAMGQYTQDHTLAWAEKVASFDGYLFVTPEYNHSTSGALKNAIDFVYAEWNNKAAGFVSYGSAGGVRAVENLRLIAAARLVEAIDPDVRSQAGWRCDDVVENDHRRFGRSRAADADQRRENYKCPTHTLHVKSPPGDTLRIVFRSNNRSVCATPTLSHNVFCSNEIRLLMPQAIVALSANSFT